MYNYVQVKHKAGEDVLGQMLSFDTWDEMLLEYHQQMKNAINNAEILGMDVSVLDMHLNVVFADKWIRGAHDGNPQTEE